MTADYAARVRTLAARHNREWQLLVEDMDRERTKDLQTMKVGRCSLLPCTGTKREDGNWYCFNPNCNWVWETVQRRHAEAEEHA